MAKMFIEIEDGSLINIARIESIKPTGNTCIVWYQWSSELQHSVVKKQYNELIHEIEKSNAPIVAALPGYFVVNVHKDGNGYFITKNPVIAWHICEFVNDYVAEPICTDEVYRHGSGILEPSGQVTVFNDAEYNTLDEYIASELKDQSISVVKASPPGSKEPHNG